MSANPAAGRPTTADRRERCLSPLARPVRKSSMAWYRPSLEQRPCYVEEIQLPSSVVPSVLPRTFCRSPRRASRGRNTNFGHLTASRGRGPRTFRRTPHRRPLGGQLPECGGLNFGLNHSLATLPCLVPGRDLSRQATSRQRRAIEARPRLAVGGTGGMDHGVWRRRIVYDTCIAEVRELEARWQPPIDAARARVQAAKVERHRHSRYWRNGRTRSP
jgi:hypothetical protein